MDGWGLLHALLADAADDLLVRVAGDAAAAAAAAADAWQLVGALADEPMRGNAMGAPPRRASPCSPACSAPPRADRPERSRSVHHDSNAAARVLLIVRTLVGHLHGGGGRAEPRPLAHRQTWRPRWRRRALTRDAALGAGWEARPCSC